MIIEDKEVTLLLAHKTANKLLEIIESTARDSNLPDDPAEHIYFILHTIGSLTGRICYVLEEYAKVYGISGLTSKSCHKWLNSIHNEFIDSLVTSHHKIN